MNSIPLAAMILFVLQLSLGAAFLTGKNAVLEDRFWRRGLVSDDDIRSAFLPKDIGPVRRLEKVLPPDARVYALSDPGDMTVFLNYYLYPRRFFIPNTLPWPIPSDEPPEFWRRVRQLGYPWVLVYRPSTDPVGYGVLLRVEPESASPPVPDPSPSFSLSTPPSQEPSS